MFQLAEVNSSLGTQCMEIVWQNNSSNEDNEETFCDAIWDSVHCWPPTPSGVIVKRSCAEIFEQSYPQYANQLQGYATRECLNDGTWAEGNQTNYDECSASFILYVERTEEDNIVVPIVHHMLFFGSILSLVCLAPSLVIFYNFRFLQCDRVTIYGHLMISLFLRFVSMLIISEPFVIGHRSSFRDVDILCKIILVVYLYSTFSSISWMFVQGLFLNLALMTGFVTIDIRYQLPIYYLIGWGVPAGFLGIYVILMIPNNQQSCWEGYSDMNEMWIIFAPITVELVINGIFLLNVLRILLEKVRNSNSRADTSQLGAAAKATAVLFPVLGINNLVLLYNPGGDYNKYFVLLNTFFGSTQGIFVAAVFCLVDKEVKAAIRRAFDRVKARRILNSRQAHASIRPDTTPVIEMFTIRETNQPDNNKVEDSV